MYVINDIELLCRLCKNKVIDHVPSAYSIGCTNLRVHDYSYTLRSYVSSLGYISTVSVDEHFDTYVTEMSVRYLALSTGEISTFYYAFCNSTSCIILSEDDYALREAAKAEKINTIDLDEFIVSAIKDERKLKLYNLIKSVA